MLRKARVLKGCNHEFINFAFCVFSGLRDGPKLMHDIAIQQSGGKPYVYNAAEGGKINLYWPNGSRYRFTGAT